MLLTVGEVGKALGISHELIRYYVAEGLIHPHKNEKNGYWEYSSDDILKLANILFYRNHQLSMKEIKMIMSDLPVEKIGDVIHQRKSELIAEVKHKMEVISELDQWETLYKEELNLIGRYKIGAMPLELRCSDYIDKNKNIAIYLEKFLNLNKTNWNDVSISLYYDINEDSPCMKQYLSISGDIKIRYSTIKGDVFEEQENQCIITEAYQDNLMDVFSLIIQYAKDNHYHLKGQFYIRENTNYFINNQRHSLYKIYAPFL